MDREEWEVDLRISQLTPLPTSSGGSPNMMGIKQNKLAKYMH